MITGITTFCFFASYTVALALEISRLWLRSNIRGLVMIFFAAAGLFAQTLFLFHRASTAEGIPLSSPYDWFLMAAWVLAALYLYLSLYHREQAIGVFLLPMVLAIVGAARFARQEPLERDPAIQLWGTIHGVFQLAVIVAVAFGFAAGIMYLVQARRLKRKLPPTQGLRLPSLEWLARASGRALIVAAVMSGLGFLSGVILNAVNHASDREHFSWNDPIVWRSALMLAWFVVAALFSVYYKPARQGRKVAYLTSASFALLVISLTLSLLLKSEHGGRQSDAKPPSNALRNSEAL